MTPGRRAFMCSNGYVIADSAPDTLRVQELVALTPAARFNIYRRNIMSTLRAALGDIYPTTKSVMGQPDFLAAADRFIQQTPSPSGDLNQFGREWPDFLGTYLNTSAATPHHAPDMARLDWAWHEAFHAADSATQDLSRLAAVPDAQYAALIFSLHPSTRLLKSAYPLFQIWQAHQPGDQGDADENPAAIIPEAGEDFLIVHRGDADVTLMQLSPAQYCFLSACAQQKTLAEAADAASEADTAFELQAFLVQAVQQNIIVDFSGVVY